MQSQHSDLLTPDQRHLVRRAAADIELEFTGTFGRETVERFVADSLAQLLPTARFTTYLPLLTERFARERLRALAKLEGLDISPTPCVLFLCVHNSGRSQIAAGWMRHITEGSILVWSAGSEPGSEINTAAIEAMAEVGIDITGEFPKPWTDEVVQAADVVVTMGCGDACPVYPGKRYEDWVLQLSTGADLLAARTARDEIRPRVENLAATLGQVIQ
jgi:protein-tyrosine-phosphatase